MGALAGRSALVTGGSRGIGLAAARGLGAQGARLVLVGRDAERLDAAVDALDEEGLDATGVALDVADLEQVRRLAAVSAEQPVDVLVHAAGVMSQRAAKPLRTTPEEWRRVLGTNLGCRTDMGGLDAPRSAEEGAETAVWLACRDEGPTGLLWEDRAVVPW
ncbi:MAG: SDR family NAD(P)-dependent oxidoreductase [Mycobacteriales bacterium]|nr:SDR family NAD(P)-dependent oxidoreductase [Mycobacteriales bacterium]